MRLNASLLLCAGALAFISCTRTASPATADTAVTPLPASVSAGEGAPFVFNSSTTLWIDADSATRALYSEMAGGLSMASSPDESNSVRFILTPEAETDSTFEGYTLTIDNNAITATAPNPSGLFYALQTIRDLRDESEAIAPATINDAPRLAYRGMMLDVSRHFRDKEFIKKQIDAMARVKLNNLHLHLTDAAGWRMEIKAYPRLTSLAAWRKGATWKEWDTTGKQYAEEGSPEASGGYFTQDDLRELVAYAAQRHINIVPEIEMPSHSEEVLTAYPSLSCTGTPYVHSDFCVGNDSVFVFIERVLDEVMAVFPSKLIHIGGDEAPKTAWHKCPKCKSRMAREGLKSVDELQSYMIHRVEDYLNAHGRDLLGWDEIMEGGLTPNATVMSWRGTEGGERAAAEGHRVIMTPGAYCYLDSNQDAPYSQPLTIGGYLPLEKIYGYDPAPDSIPQLKDHLYGLQGNLWCEHIVTDSLAEYQLWPRMVAIAEAAWTPQERRDYESFRPRAIRVAERMNAEGYYAFNPADEIGNRPEYADTLRHLAYGKKVIYNEPYWTNYTAAGEKTLTDGLRGGWAYNDSRWQGFMRQTSERVDVTIDMEQPTRITSISADFMQICGPDVWMPKQVIISVSDDGKNYTTLATIDHEVVRTEEISFETFGWTGEATARYIRYQAIADHGVIFIDEIVVK